MAFIPPFCPHSDRENHHLDIQNLTPDECAGQAPLPSRTPALVDSPWMLPKRALRSGSPLPLPKLLQDLQPPKGTNDWGTAL